MDEYQLRLVKNGLVLVQLVVPERQTFDWRPGIGTAPLGKCQWFHRRSGMRRWFKLGPTITYGR